MRGQQWSFPVPLPTKKVAGLHIHISNNAFGELLIDIHPVSGNQFLQLK